jgi:rare lipoprotein A
MIWRENWKPYTALILGVLAILMFFWYAVPVRAASCYQVGKASFYGFQHHGRHTASGKVFNQWGLTAAHTTLPFGTKLRVTYQGRSVDVTVNDRGDFAKYGRVIDLSRGAFRKLANERVGVLRGVCLTRIR